MSQDISLADVYGALRRPSTGSVASARIGPHHQQVYRPPHRKPPGYSHGRAVGRPPMHPPGFPLVPAPPEQVPGWDSAFAPSYSMSVPAEGEEDFDEMIERISDEIGREHLEDFEDQGGDYGWLEPVDRFGASTRMERFGMESTMTRPARRFAGPCGCGRTTPPDHGGLQPFTDPRSTFWDAAKVGAGVGVGLLAVGIAARAIAGALS